MKYMKLGSKPDSFQSDGSSIRFVPAELATDVTINVGDVKFYLHKFPLLSKSNLLQKMVMKASEENSDEIHLVNFPGGAKAFEICAKFCYGMTVILNAYNVVAARCAAEYLEMIEDVDRGNLIFKIEVFLNSSVFRSWKDSILVLQTTKSLLPWSEDLKIVGRCIDSIASKIYMDPANVTWSYAHNRKLAASDRIVEEDMKFPQRNESVPKDWWVEDVCELDIDLYKRLIVTVRSKGRIDGNVIGEALKTYAVRWLPDRVEYLLSDAHRSRNKTLVETLISLLPSDVIGGCSCNFLLKLLKVSTLVGIDDLSREALVKRVSLKFHEASFSDLLIPARSPQTTIYDVELVTFLLKQFVMQEKSVWDFNAKGDQEQNGDVMIEHSSMLKVAKLIDGYLGEVAKDPNLSLSSFVDLARSIPNSARAVHDMLYRAIDLYLKEHPNLTKTERKKICGLMDVKKLTMYASMHAAQNERLPLRVVVQVLYFEQVRAAGVQQALSKTNSVNTSRSTTNTDEESDRMTLENSKSLRKQMNQIKLKDDEPRKNGKLGRKNSRSSRSGIQLLPSRSRRIFDKLWVVGKGQGGNRSSETSVSSQSPTSMVPGDTKSSGSSSRHRRHSIS